MEQPTTPGTHAAHGTPDEVTIRLTAAELELVRSALRMLRATLGREEAEELHEVQAILRRLDERA